MSSTCTDSTWDGTSVYSSSSEYVSDGGDLDMFKTLRAFVNTMPSNTEMPIPATALLDLLQFTMKLQERCDYFADAAATFQRSLKISEIMMRNECPKISTNLDLFLAALKVAKLEGDKVKLNEYAATEPSDMDVNRWIASALARLEPTPDRRNSSSSRSESARHLYSAARITPELAEEINGSLRALDMFHSSREATGFMGNWGSPKRATALLEYAPGLKIGCDPVDCRDNVIGPLNGRRGTTSLRAVDHHENPHAPAEAPHHREFYAFRNERYTTGVYYHPPSLCTVLSNVGECSSVVTDDSVYAYQRALTATSPASRAPSEYEEPVAALGSGGQHTWMDEGDSQNICCSEMGLLSHDAPQRPAVVQPAAKRLPRIPPAGSNAGSPGDRRRLNGSGVLLFGVPATIPPDCQPATLRYPRQSVKAEISAGMSPRVPPHIRDIRKTDPSYLLSKYPAY